MAGAVPTASSTKETTNYSRLCRLLVDVGTQALRDTFNNIHSPANLEAVLRRNKAMLQLLRARKIINPTQLGKLFPVNPSSVSSTSFDITLLMVLLRNVCGLAAPETGWDARPAATDMRLEADIARVKYFRNTVVAHAEQASVDDATFNRYWSEIRDALVRLGGVAYRAAIDSLETECMDPDVEEHYKQLLQQWKNDESNIKDDLKEIGNDIKNLTKKVDDLVSSTMTSKMETSDKDQDSNSPKEVNGIFSRDCTDVPDAPGKAQISVNDRVIAHWTNNLYYAGQVSSIENHQINVLFDGGDRITHSIRDISAVIPDQEPHQVQIGRHVVTTWKGGHKYHIGYVTEKNCDVFKVTFDENDEDFCLAKQLRIFPEHNSPHKVGARVFARWNNGLYYRGFVTKATSTNVFITYDDGDTITLLKSDRTAVILDKLPCYSHVKPGQRVIGYWPGRTRYYPGVVESKGSTGSNNYYHVKFDDGDQRMEDFNQIRLIP